MRSTPTGDGDTGPRLELWWHSEQDLWRIVSDRQLGWELSDMVKAAADIVDAAYPGSSERLENLVYPADAHIWNHNSVDENDWENNVADAMSELGYLLNDVAAPVEDTVGEALWDLYHTLWMLTGAGPVPACQNCGHGPQRWWGPISLGSPSGDLCERCYDKYDDLDVDALPDLCQENQTHNETLHGIQPALTVDGGAQCPGQLTLDYEGT